MLFDTVIYISITTVRDCLKPGNFNFTNCSHLPLCCYLPFLFGTIAGNGRGDSIVKNVTFY
ncbi:MAG: hypothetical protein JWQ40_3609 [Segetibacter sp.]|nr:hypothetical protein [Segetibacter sp.]